MRRNHWAAALAAFFVLSGTSWCRQSNQSQASTQTSAPAQDQTAQTPPPQQDSLAEAARKARAQKKDEPTPSKVFTNENIPSVASVPAAESISGASTGAGPDAASGKASPNDEKMWRDKFAKLNHQLDQDQAMLDVLQRELGVLNTQYYGGDPVKAMQQGMSQSDVTAKTEKIDAKKKDVEADKQAIADAEADLQKSGGDPGWGR